MPIRVRCKCGQVLTASDSMAGKRARCPHCQTVFLIPAKRGGSAPSRPKPTSSKPAPADADPLGGDMSWAGAGDPLQQSGLGSSGGWPAGSQGSWGAPPGAGWAAAPQKRAARSGVPAAVVLLIAVGVVVLLLVVVGAIALVIGLSSSRTEVAVQPPVESTAPAESDTEDSATPDSDSNDPSPPSQSEPDRDDQPRSDTSSSGELEAQHDAESSSTSTSETSPEPKKKGLPEATVEWHTSGNQLRGATPAGNEELVLLHFSWMTHLLPYLGHEETYLKLDFRVPWARDPNLTVSRTVIPEFLNPSDKRRVSTDLRTLGVAMTHFAGVSGVEDRRNVVAAELPRSDPRAGIFGYREVATDAQITDGKSQTLMVIGSGELIGPWIQGGGSTVRGAREPYFDPITGFGSRGASKPGALAVMADGSVRFISADVDPAVFRAMCTIHGAESVDAEALGIPLDQLRVP